MNAEKKQLAFAILEFLQTCINDKSVGEGDAESLQVAMQCIGETFGVDPSSSTDVSKYSVKPASLANIFGVFLNAQKKRSGGEQKENVASTNVSDELRGKAEELKAKGNAKLVEKKFDEAINFYSQAIELVPSNAVYYCNRAAAYSQLSKHNEAVEDCKKSISIDPAYVKAYSRLGLAYFSLGNYEDAIEAYTKGLNLDASNEAIKQGIAAAEQKLKSSPVEEIPRSEPGNAGSGAGAGPGGLDFASLLNNPAIMNMAQQFMSNPEMAGMMGNLMGGAGGSGGGGNPLANLMNNPEVMRMAQQFSQNPDIADTLKNVKK